MRNLAKKIRLCAFLLAFIPLTSGAVLLPLGWGLGLVTGVTTASLILPLTAASIVVGAAITWITVGGTPNNQINTAPLQVQIDPKAPLETPPGWTDPVAPAVKPTPPSTYQSPPIPSANVPTTTVQNWDTAMGGAQCVVYFNTATANTYFMMAPSAAGCPGVLTQGYTGASLQNPPRYLFQTSPWGPAVPGYNCPNYNGATRAACTLTNATLVQKPADSRCTIVRTGNSYGVDPQDPDCAAGLPAEWNAGPNSISWGGKGNGDGGGSITTDAVTGETTIINKKQNSDGTTTITTIKTGAPVPGAAAGAGVTVKGISENTVVGQGTLQGSTAPGGIEMPTDYNREPTQQQIKTGIDSLNTKLDATGVDSTLSAEKSALDSAAQAQIDALATATNRTSSGLGFTFGFPDPGACSPLTFAIPGAAGRTLVIDWCPAQAPIKSIGSFIVSLFAAMYLFSLGTSLFNRT